MTSPTRKLAAILAADVVGYSRLMGEDQAGTLDALRQLRKELFEPIVEEFRGNVVKRMGDGWIVEFASVSDAVDCAMRFQLGLADHEIIRLRAGIHIGEVVFEDEDVFGEGVNVAARLEELAEPGEVLISDTVHNSLDEKAARQFSDGDTQSLKNIARPVQVWHWSSSGTQQAIQAESETLPLPDKPSIAVLSFDNMSGDADQEYFSDGIAEDIITALSKVHWLFVIARNTTFTYKGSAVDVTRVAKELGVRYVVEGSVRKAGNKVRITAQLIDGTNGNHVWAERYDRELDDIFAVQDEITENIVGRVDNEVRVSEIDRARRKLPATLDAWELYQRGLWHAYRPNQADNIAALSLFAKAVERDPNFALAHAGMAFTCAMEVFQDFGDDPAATLAKGLAAGEQAVALDDKDGFTHFALGRMLLLTGQGDRAIAALEITIALNPSFAQGYFGLGQTLVWYGRAADGIPKLDMAMRLSPHDPMLWAMHTMRAVCCNALKRYDEAEEWVRKSVNVRPDVLMSHVNLVHALAGQGRLDEARIAIEAARRIRPDLSSALIRSNLRHYHQEYLERLIDALRQAGFPEA
jgi:adenylate cyclase